MTAKKYDYGFFFFSPIVLQTIPKISQFTYNNTHNQQYQYFPLVAIYATMSNKIRKNNVAQQASIKNDSKTKRFLKFILVAENARNIAQMAPPRVYRASSLFSIQMKAWKRNKNLVLIYDCTTQINKAVIRESHFITPISG